MGARVKFLNVSDAVLKYVLSVGEEEKEIIEKTVKITALDLMFRQPISLRPKAMKSLFLPLRYRTKPRA